MFHNRTLDNIRWVLSALPLHGRRGHDGGFLSDAENIEGAHMQSLGEGTRRSRALSCPTASAAVFDKLVERLRPQEPDRAHRIRHRHAPDGHAEGAKAA